jgi:hypothetical protein
VSSFSVGAGPTAEEVTRSLSVTGVRNASSLGVARYSGLLRDALISLGVDYRLAVRGNGACNHYHLANSSRSLLLRKTTPGARLVVTVHDVVPRTPLLSRIYRARVYPQLIEPCCAVVVHSAFAADMVVREAGIRPGRLEVIAHPARRPEGTDRAAAREALRWPAEQLIAVLPGVIKSTKLVREAVAAASRLPGWRLALVGKLRDRSTVRAAEADGVLVVDTPNDREYDDAIVASDCVLCLRSGSVGETNGPLLDAIGAGRAVLATQTGSIPEVGADAVLYCDGTVDGIRMSLAQLSDQSTRSNFERAAEKRAQTLTWDGSATLHADLFREVFDA